MGRGSRRSHRRRRALLGGQQQPLDPDTAVLCIVGTGLAGLSTAICLQQAGFRNIHLYERDVSFAARKEGYGLTLTYNPSGILEHLGVLDELASLDCPSRSHYLFGCEGEILGYFGNAFSSQPRGWGQRGNLRVPRQKVRKVLMEKLLSGADATIHWNHKLIDIRSRQDQTIGVTDENNPTANSSGMDDDRLELVFEHNYSDKPSTISSILADVVVAADGIRSSVVRSWIPRSPLPKSMGIRLIIGLSESSIHDKHALVNQRGFYTLGRGKRLFVMPFSEDDTSILKDDHEGNKGNSETPSSAPHQTMWQISFASDDTGSYNPEELRHHALEETEGWHRPVHDLILSSPAHTIWGTQLYDQDPQAIQRCLLGDTPKGITLPSSSSSSSSQSSEVAPQQRPHRVLVVGDALHAMSPFKGQGANQCLQDGATVAKWLAGRASLRSAVRGALRELVQRTAPVVHASRQAAHFWHSPEALEVQHAFAGVAVAGVARAVAPTTAHSVRSSSGPPFPTSGTEAAPTTHTTPRTEEELEHPPTEDTHSRTTLPKPPLDPLLATNDDGRADFWRALRQEGITAESQDLDLQIKELIRTLNSSSSHDSFGSKNNGVTGTLDEASDHDTSNASSSKKAIVEDGEPPYAGQEQALREQAQQAAKVGDLGTLRKISWKHSNFLREELFKDHSNTENDDDDEEEKANRNPLLQQRIKGASSLTCLHLAVSGNHWKMVHWLVTEAGCDFSRVERASLLQLSPSSEMTRLLDRLYRDSQPSGTN